MSFGLGILMSVVQSANAKYLLPTASYILPITFPLSCTALTSYWRTLLSIEKIILNSSLLHFIRLKSSENSVLYNRGFIINILIEKLRNSNEVLNFKFLKIVLKLDFAKLILLSQC